MENTIQLIHPAGKKGVSMNKDKYDVVKRSLLDRLRTGGESTHKQILQAINADFANNGTNFDGAVEWHMEWVKLDLEARRQIVRIGSRSPIMFALAAPTAS